MVGIVVPWLETTYMEGMGWFGKPVNLFLHFACKGYLGDRPPRPPGKGESIRSSPLPNPLGAMTPESAVKAFGLGLEVIATTVGGLSEPLNGWWCFEMLMCHDL